MKIPTPDELLEFNSLFVEFKDWKEDKSQEPLSSRIVRTLIQPLPKDDAIRVHAERLIRYNQYTALRTKFAPWFYNEMMNTKGVNNELLPSEEILPHHHD